jgi:hypothetical protein
MRIKVHKIISYSDFAVDKVVTTKAFYLEPPIDHIEQLATLVGNVQSCDLLFSGCKYFGVCLTETLQNEVTLYCRSPRLEQQRHMWQIIINFDLSNVRRVSSHDVVGYVYNEIYLDGLLLSLLPVLVNALLLLAQLLYLVPYVQAS